MSHITMTVEQVRAHQERIGRQMAAREQQDTFVKEGPGAKGCAASDGITLTLPYPISSNRYWRSFMPKGQTRAIVVLSDEAKAFKANVKSIVRLAGISTPLRGRVAIDVQLFPARPKDWVKRAQRDPDGWDNSVQSIDLDNALKVTIDSLKDSLIEDDKFVWRLTAARMEPDGDACMRVMVRRIIAAPKQVSLL